MSNLNTFVLFLLLSSTFALKHLVRNEEKNGSLKYCVSNFIRLQFRQVFPIYYISDGLQPILPQNEENQFVVINSLEILNGTLNYTGYYILHAENSTALDNMLIKLLYNTTKIKYSPRRKCLILTSSTSISEIFEILWKHLVVRSAVILYNEEYPTIYTSNPYDAENKCGYYSKLQVNTSCNGESDLFQDVPKNFQNCTLGFKGNSDDSEGDSEYVVANFIVGELGKYFNLFVNYSAEFDQRRGGRGSRNGNGTSDSEGGRNNSSGTGDGNNGAGNYSDGTKVRRRGEDDRNGDNRSDGNGTGDGKKNGRRSGGRGRGKGRAGQKLSIFVTTKNMYDDEKSSSIFYDNFVWVIPLQKNPSVKTLQYIFEGQVWMMIGAAFLVTLLTWYFLARVAVNGNSVLSTFLGVWSLTLLGCISKLPQPKYLKSLVLFYLLFIIVIQTAFKTNLARVLTVEQYESSIKDIEDLKNSERPLCIYPFINRFVKTDNDTIKKRIKNVHTIDDIIIKKDCAYLVLAQYVGYLKHHVKIHYFTDNSMTGAYECKFSIRKGHFFVKTLNDFIARLEENGILDYEILKNNRKRYPKSTLKNEELVVLTFEHVSSIFYIWAIGIILSIVVFILEIVNHKMDKYTVDLDKVLNDFEYSELTDQYSAGAHLNTISQRNQDSYKYNNGPSKHTINNVFQSLNEYLNTDIGTSQTSFAKDLCETLVNTHTQSLVTITAELEDTVESFSQLESNEEVPILAHTAGTRDAVNNTETVQEIVEEGTLIDIFPKEEDNVILMVEETVVSVKDESEITAENEKKSIAIGFNHNIDINESELNEYLEELDNECQNEKEAIVVSQHPEPPEILISHTSNNIDDEECNSLLRPSSLQINNSSQIDLVGEPGSTPYNNVYVSNTLAVTRTVPESEDSSPSPSPTFSEVSSESNGSTATTESVTDSITDKPGASYENPSSDTETLKDNISNKIQIDDIDIEAKAIECVPDEAELLADTENLLGKQAPLWIPDSEADSCLHCDTKFTVIKRRHHCRACGLVLCSKCSNKKCKLEYLDSEARVCIKCYNILSKDTNNSGDVSPSSGNSPNHQCIPPNPNNPMEYCSMIPPLQQCGTSNQDPPTVMVPVGVLKRKGSTRTRTNKSVMFCDGIRPGSELTNLDNDFNYHDPRKLDLTKSTNVTLRENKNGITVDSVTKSFIPISDNGLPPVVKVYKSDISYSYCENNAGVVETLKNEMFVFAIQSNLHVHLKIINMDCCINKCAWCFSTEGMISVGQDEIVLLLEFVDNEKTIPKDIFLHLNTIYLDAKSGTSISEYGMSLHETNNFLESKNHMGFLYIRPTFQCLQNVIIPKEQFLIGILFHKWEMPWAKIFPLRLVLRLGAEYRYYPSPIISTRHRESVFVEIGHTIINLLADFRNFSYTLPNIRGLTIHMEEKNTTVTIPLNRYDQVLKTLNNSSDHILAFGGNFSMTADSHLVCIQDTQGNNENTYTTHAINIHNRPRKVTGASYIVFNGALKSSSGLTAKSSIVEDGLMIQIPPEHMVQIRDSLKNMKSYSIQCGCINAISDEVINIIWGENDVYFNNGVQSAIDNRSLGGVPSIRVHNGKDFICNSGSKLIRWTEVFILQSGEDNVRGLEVDFSKLAESISKATCQALVKYLDLLASNNFNKIGIRTNLHVENVSYCAGSNGMKLPPIYMKSLDNELIPVLHRITSNNLGDSAIILELVFRILNV
ncbi:hypothetical protein FQA39_LY18058 [Lamprigera yunnana]|nr:hypothetical protein FQA39_LY18058 [Lamprigera yunnana]